MIDNLELIIEILNNRAADADNPDVKEAYCFSSLMIQKALCGEGQEIFTHWSNEVRSVFNPYE